MKRLATKTAGSRFNLDDARRLVALSDIAYAGLDEAPRKARKLGASKSVLIDTGSTEALVSKFGPDVFVTFRGTETGPGAVLDVFRDASILLREMPNVPGRVHDGFATGVEKAAAEIIEAIDTFREPDGFVQIGGHSKGGGEALLFAAYLVGGGFWQTTGVHVFGAPAVGDAEFAKLFDHSLGLVTFRHVFRSDVVARAPIFLRLRGIYRDVGQLVYHSPAGRTFRPSPIRKAVDFVRAFSRVRGRRDHDLWNYIQGLEK